VEDYVELNTHYQREGEGKGFYATARYYLMNEKLEIQKITEKKLYWSISKKYGPNILEEKVIFDITKS
jgi:hypothetical protein